MDSPNQDAQLTEREGDRMNRNRMKLGARLALAVATVGVALMATATPAQADTFNLTSCHISTGCPAAGTIFGTVTLTQVGANVNFDVELANGSTFVETGAGADSLFVFNATGIVAADIVNEATVNPANAVPGGLNGVFLNGAQADGTGHWNWGIQCVTAANCNGGSTPDFTGLTFTVLNATIADFLTFNDGGNIFVADILCGPTVTGCAGFTGPVDVTGGGSVPDGGATVMLLGSALFGLGVLRRRFGKR
jgi:VPDSG-CTERM motif